MASNPNASLTQITPPRVAFLDPRNGLISREWYLWFLNLFQKVGNSTLSLEELQIAPDTNAIMAAYDAALFSIEEAALSQPVPDFGAQFRDLEYAALTQPRTEYVFPALEDLVDVAIVSPTDGDLLIYDSATATWGNAQITAGAHIVVTPGPGSITITTTGASGSFTTVDLKTVTVANGIITSIV